VVAKKDPPRTQVPVVLASLTPVAIRYSLVKLDNGAEVESRRRVFRSATRCG
jgi:hypothetical protein